jgi:hypothetical protein
MCLKALPIKQCCQRHNAILPVETFEKKERLLILPLEIQRWKAEGISKNSEPFIYGDLHEITNSFCKSPKIATHLPRQLNALLVIFTIISIIYCTVCTEKYISKLRHI